MAKKTETFLLEDVRPRLMRSAFVPTLVAVTDDPDYVDDETVLGTDDVTAAKIGGAPLLTKEAPAPKCGKGALIREVALGQPLAPAKAWGDDEDDEVDALSVTFIRDWREVEDWPSGRVEVLAAALEVSPKSEATREKLEALAEAMDDAELETLDGVKIAGWPRWVSEPETVKCKCKAVMNPVIQLGEDAVVVGDAGTTWILACSACGKKAYVCQQ